MSDTEARLFTICIAAMLAGIPLFMPSKVKFVIVAIEVMLLVAALFLKTPLEIADFVVPLGWIAAAILGPGPLYLIPWSGAVVQFVIYISILGWSREHKSSIRRALLNVATLHFGLLTTVILTTFLDQHTTSGH